MPKQFLLTKGENGTMVARKPLKNECYYMPNRWAEDTHIVSQLDECKDIAHLRILIFEYCEANGLTEHLPKDLVEEVNIICDLINDY